MRKWFPLRSLEGFLLRHKFLMLTAGILTAGAIACLFFRHNRPVWFLLLESLLAAACFIYMGYRLLVGRKPKRQLDGHDHMRPSTIIRAASALLLFTIWMLRFSVAFHSIDCLTVSGVLEKLTDSLLHAFQTFSLDESYADRIGEGQALLKEIVGAEPWLASLNAETIFVAAYTWYAAVLNVLAPALGTALVADFLLEFFPGLHHWFAKSVFMRETYYFSELNDKSIALATSVLKNSSRKVNIIFTDAYVDDEEERSSERFADAKALGAICLKKDLLHIRFSRGKKKPIKLFLIDEEESSNLQTLDTLLKNTLSIAYKTEIYIFSSDRIYSHLEDEVSFILNQKGADARKSYPAVIPINGVRNMTFTLFMGCPLYEPLIDKAADADGKKTLTVTILGSGAIGTEFFLATYWCGQMLDCKLHVNVISKEKQNQSGNRPGDGDFEGRINYINPDILQTADPASPLLRHTCGDDRTEPYFTYNYIESDVFSGDFLSTLQKPFREGEADSLLDTDYFIVALGSDEENFAVADRIRQLVGAHHLWDAPDRKTVIGYVIYHSELCRTLNENSRHRHGKNAKHADVYMRAFGSLEEVYGVDNPFFGEMAKGVHAIGEAYDANRNEKKTDKERNTRFKDIYSHQSNLARRIHRKYKEYSAGFHRLSVFTAGDAKAYEAHQEEAKLAYAQHVALDQKAQGSPALQKMHELAWLEHRRWCAYLRTKGFRNPGEQCNEKFVSLKLHNCLVECGTSGIDAELDDYGFVIAESEFEHNEIRDLLDLVSHRKYDQTKKDAEQSGQTANKPDDYKRWDYPSYEFESDELLRVLDESGNFSKVEKGSLAEKIDVRMIYRKDGERYISVERFTHAAAEKAIEDKAVKEGQTPKALARMFADGLNEIHANVSTPFSAQAANVEMIPFAKADAYYRAILQYICDHPAG